MNLPPDPDGQNDDRASWAGAAIERFIGVTRTDFEDAPSDLLCDLMHWCDRNGFTFANELERAYGHYSEETYDYDAETESTDKEA